MHIRVAVADDSLEVAPLLAQLGYPSSPQAVAARFARVAGNENDAAWVAVDDSASVIDFAAGHITWLYELDRPVAELTSLIVDESLRGSGAGRALVIAFEEWVTAAGCVRATAASAFHRTGAHAFYERLGYAQLAKKNEKSL